MKDLNMLWENQVG